MTLLTGAYVAKLDTDSTGRYVDAVRATRNGCQAVYRADIGVVAYGALSSALLLLRSANEQHPNRLANGSDQVGRNDMRQGMRIVMAVMTHVNETIFQNTLALSDFYFGSGDWDYPLGLIQMCATRHTEQITGEEVPVWLGWLPKLPFDQIARHSMDFWLQVEDLIVDDIGWPAMRFDRTLYLGKNIPLSGTAHQAGTCRFCSDPATSVLDLDCRAREVDNLYVTDASFFP
ncbi:MAG: GMC oxidoreductase [Burkholderiaceae bacterium]